MDPGSTKQLVGLVTYSGKQSSTSLLASRSELAAAGIHFRLYPITRSFSRRIWRYWRSPLRDLRCVGSLLVRRYDFLLLNPATALMRRPRLLRLLLRISDARQIPTFVRWGSCQWLLDNKRSQIGSNRFESLVARISRPGIRHLTLTPQAAQDLAVSTGISESHVIWNCFRLPSEFDVPTAPAEPPLIVNVASVQTRKGPDLFLEVASSVCSAHPTASFVWIGDAATEELQGEIDRRGLSDRVRFVGPVFPPYEWLQKASCLLFTSRSEAFGLAVAEAMACHRTVFCFQGTGAASVVGDTGFTASRFNVERLAGAILEFLATPPIERVNRDAHLRYQDLFSTTAFALRLSAVLRDPEKEFVRHGMRASTSITRT
jgi:glycosyltransferase involved in cell wall biosynthesis